MGDSPEYLERTVPTLYLLRSAFRVSRLVSSSAGPIQGLREAYPRLPTDGLFDERAFRHGEALLQRVGLLKVTAGRVTVDERIGMLKGLQELEACRVLLALLLQSDRPLWLRVAAGGSGVRDVYIPEDVKGRLRALFPDDSGRDAFLVALGHVDSESRTELGRKGEEAVVTACRRQRRDAGFPRLAEGVQQVSRLSDGLGYDVSAPRPDAPPYHLEVKTVGREEKYISVHVSRHQMQVGRKDPSWLLIICRKAKESVDILGWCGIDRLETHLPQDREGNGEVDVRWATVQALMAPQVLIPGLPPLRAMGA